MGPREHELRIVQGERRPVEVTVVRLHLGERRRIAGSRRVKQLPGLTFQLIQIGMLAKRTCGRLMGGHDELLPGCALRQPCARCPLTRAEKSSSRRRLSNAFTQGDAVLSADTVAS